MNENKFSYIKDRVVYLADLQGKSKESFFKEIGMTSANFRGKALKTPLNSNAIENIFTCYPNLNIEWLITGKGEMFKEENNVVSEPGASYSTAIESSKSLEKKYISLLEEKIKVMEKEKQFLEKEINAFKSRLSKYEGDRQKELVEQHQK